jgi:hypothetical protein
MAKASRRGKAVLHCGRNSQKGLAHGCGSGRTGPEAIQAATAEAQLVAQAAGHTWIATHSCPRGCPIKGGAVNSPPKGTKVRALSENIIRKTVGQPRPGVLIPPGGDRIVRVCVVVPWEAVIVCDAR